MFIDTMNKGDTANSYVTRIFNRAITTLERDYRSKAYYDSGTLIGGETMKRDMELVVTCQDESYFRKVEGYLTGLNDAIEQHGLDVSLTLLDENIFQLEVNFDVTIAELQV